METLGTDRFTEQVSAEEAAKLKIESGRVLARITCTSDLDDYEEPFFLSLGGARVPEYDTYVQSAGNGVALDLLQALACAVHRYDSRCKHKAFEYEITYWNGPTRW